MTRSGSCVTRAAVERIVGVGARPLAWMRRIMFNPFLDSHRRLRATSSLDEAPEIGVDGFVVISLRGIGGIARATAMVALPNLVHAINPGADTQAWTGSWAHCIERFGLIVFVIGGSMIGPAFLLHSRAGHLVAPRPIVLVFIFAGMLIAGLLSMLIGEILG
jgi:hypothetical protein